MRPLCSYNLRNCLTQHKKEDKAQEFSVIAQIAKQVSVVFVLPFVIMAIIILINNKKDMGFHKAVFLVNTGLFGTLIFACFITYTGIIALRQFF